MELVPQSCADASRALSGGECWKRNRRFGVLVETVWEKSGISICT